MCFYTNPDLANISGRTEVKHQNGVKLGSGSIVGFPHLLGYQSGHQIYLNSGYFVLLPSWMGGGPPSAGPLTGDPPIGGPPSGGPPSGGPPSRRWPTKW